MPVTNAVEKVRAFYEKDIATRIPFATHPLKIANGYAKELYVTMLAAILQYEHEPMREQTIFLERILVGVGIESSVQEIMKRAQMMDEKFAKDFYDEFVEQPLAENFIVDALVMTNCVVKVNEKQLIFLSEVVDVLGTSKELFKENVNVSKAVLGLQSEKILDLVNVKGSIRILNRFKYYLDTFRDIVKPTKQMLDSMVENKEIVVFYKMKFTENALDFNVMKKKFLVFKECEFSNITSPLKFSNIQGVVFDQCVIKDSSNYIFEMVHVENICILNCTFKNVEVRRGENFIYGGLIKANEETNLYMYSSLFENISVFASYESYSAPYSSAPIYLGKIKSLDIQNNKFISCNANGSYEGNKGALIIDDFPRELNYDCDHIESQFLDDRTFLEYIQLEYNIKPELGCKNNEIKNCTPSNLMMKEE